MQAIGGAKDPALGFLGDLVQKIGLAAIALGQGQFAIAQRALPIFLDTHTHTPGSENTRRDRGFHPGNSVKQPVF
jgi:hypothetical protein